MCRRTALRPGRWRRSSRPTEGGRMRARKILIRTRWLRRAGVLSVLALAGTPIVAAAAARHDRTPPAVRAAAAGVVYGGVTPQDFGVMVEVRQSGRQIVR